MKTILIDEDEQLRRGQLRQGYNFRPLGLGGGEASAPEPGGSLPNVASATLLLDLEADTLTVGNGNPASPWLDQSGNGHHFTGNRVFHADANGGYVDGNGEDQYLEGSDFSGDMESFAVVAFIKDFGWGGHFLDKLWASEDNNSYIGVECISFDGETVNFQILDTDGITGTGCGTQEPSSVPGVIVWEQIDRGNQKIYINNIEKASSVGYIVDSHANSEPWRIGLCGGPGGVTDAGYSPHAGRAYLIYQITDPDNWPTDRTAITVWLAARYGLTL